MAVSRYMIVHKTSESRIRDAILEASVRLGYSALEPVLLDAERVREQIQQIAGDSNLVKIVVVDIERIPIEEIKRDLHDSIVYPIKPDGTMSFDDAYFPPQ